MLRTTVRTLIDLMPGTITAKSICREALGRVDESELRSCKTESDALWLVISAFTPVERLAFLSLWNLVESVEVEYESV